ncbi:MAG: hypothetical protein ACLR4C_10240 [Eubacterium ventriosum]
MLSKNLLEVNTLKILTCIGFADAGFRSALNKQEEGENMAYNELVKISNEQDYMRELCLRIQKPR